LKNAIPGLMLAGMMIGFPEAKVYEAIKEESQIVYHLKHPLHKVKGVSSDFVCTVDFSGDTLASKIMVKAPVSDFNSGNSNRDSHALEALEALKYPYVEFASDSVKREGKGYRVFGRLLFHGVTRPIDFPVIPTIGEGTIRIEGGFTIKLSDFKVKRPSLMFIPAEDALRIEIYAVTKGP
jgi:polyisoprenoid-binding protein YceI